MPARTDKPKEDRERHSYWPAVIAGLATVTAASIGAYATVRAKAKDEVQQSIGNSETELKKLQVQIASMTNQINGLQKELDSRQHSKPLRGVSPSYCGLTPKTQGHFEDPGRGTIGYQAGKTMCEAACKSSTTAHMCTTHEISILSQADKLPKETTGWISSAFRAGDEADCNGWQPVSAGQWGPIFTTKSSAGNVFIAACDKKEDRYPVFCCD